ncbi:MAG: glycoside hydrolase family 2 TIM barrel-domain containing protein [Actinomycetota bacterium]
MNTGTVLLSNVLCRRRRSLDGAWRVIVDPYETGYVGIMGGRNEHGYFRDWSARTPADRIEYDFDASPTLEVPGDWTTQRDDLRYYEGPVWYRRRFTATETPGRRTFLHVGAANHRCRVFLDGEELATHEGGFSPFAVELTGRLGGEHSLVCEVDNRRRPEAVPAMRTDWWNDGGITRSVGLVEVPETFLADAWITMTPDGGLIGGGRVDGPGAAGTTVAFELLGVRTSTATGADGTFSLDLDAPDELERWAPGRPILHDVRWSAGDDVIDDRVGFRTVRTDGTRILVNDEPTFLRGISIHAEAPIRGGRAHGADDARLLLGWAEELGANFVRLAHYQHDEHMVREADRRGLLAWCELPVYWGIDFASEATLGDALDQADELVVRDRSRASVILWSVANETPPSDERTAFLGALADRVRSHDPTRLTTAALFTMPTVERTHHVDDPFGELVDVVAVNQYLGWYYADLADVPDHEWTTAFGKPVIFSELGAGARQGHHGPADHRWTEEFQVAVYEAQLAMLANVPDLAGLSPWILCDFRTPLRVLPGIQDGWNRKGLISDRGIKKAAFETLRRFYDDRST